MSTCALDKQKLKPEALGRGSCASGDPRISVSPACTRGCVTKDDEAGRQASEHGLVDTLVWNVLFPVSWDS